jgi:hypothetical protein
MNAERTLAAVRAWKARLITAGEASEIVGVNGEAELLAAAHAARDSGSTGSGPQPTDNVRPFPTRRAAEDQSIEDSGSFIRSRR